MLTLAATDLIGEASELSGEHNSAQYELMAMCRTICRLAAYDVTGGSDG